GPPAAATSGAVKAGVALPRSASTTGDPPTWVQVYVSGSSSGSLLADPSRSTIVLSSAVWSFPALATGAWLTFSTMTLTVSVDVSMPSLTPSSKVSVSPPGPTIGAVNVGDGLVESDRMTVGPARCAQANPKGEPPASDTGLP